MSQEITIIIFVNLVVSSHATVKWRKALVLINFLKAGQTSDVMGTQSGDSIHRKIPCQLWVLEKPLFTYPWLRNAKNQAKLLILRVACTRRTVEPCQLLLDKRVFLPLNPNICQIWYCNKVTLSLAALTELYFGNFQDIGTSSLF